MSTRQEKICPMKFQARLHSKEKSDVGLECESTCEWFDEKYKVCVVVAMFKGFFMLLKGFYPSIRDKEESLEDGQ